MSYGSRAAGNNNKAAYSDIIKDLYDLAGAGFQGQALFYEKIDEMFLTAAQDRLAEENSLNYLMSYYWKEYFPDVRFNEKIQNLLFQYRSVQRSWIWSVYFRRNPSFRDTEQLRMTLEFRDCVSGGRYNRSELVNEESREYYLREVEAFLGKAAYLSSGEAEAITNARILRQLKAIYTKWEDNREKAERRGQTRRQNQRQDPPEQETLKQELPKQDPPRQDRHKQDAKNREDDKVFVNALIDQVCIQFVLNEITFGEKVTPEMSESRLIREAMNDLWSIMPPEISSQQSDWVYFAKKKIRYPRLYRALLHVKYSDIADLSVKNAAKIRICTAHVIAESEDHTLTNKEIINRIRSVLTEAFGMDAPTSSLSKSVEQYYPQGVDEKLKYDVWSFVNERKAHVDTWYKWILQTDKKQSEKERADIARMWSEFNQRMYYEENSLRKEAVSGLIRELCDRNYGNILGEMYLISKGQSKEDPSKVLRNFFLLLNNMDYHIEPFIKEGSVFPGWMINGEAIEESDEEG